jgi:hypothetical protein
MMPTFPPLPLKVRKAGFPRYGFKVGISDGAFPPVAKGVCDLRFASALRAPRCQRLTLVLSRGDAVRWCTTVQAANAALPQGPSLRSGL